MSCQIGHQCHTLKTCRPYVEVEHKFWSRFIPRALATFSVFLLICKVGFGLRLLQPQLSKLLIFTLYHHHLVSFYHCHSKLVADNDPVSFGHPKAIQYVFETVSRSLISSSSRRWDCAVFGYRIRCWHHILRCIICNPRTRWSSKNSRCNSVCSMSLQQDFCWFLVGQIPWSGTCSWQLQDSFCYVLR